MEPRALMATAGYDYILSGFQWPNPAHITYSIAPDGVMWDHGTNNINAALNAELGAGNWEPQIARALATWESVANINISETTDGPYDWDTSGDAQGDPRFGDIRFGGYNFDDNTTLAHSYFPPPDGGTGAGDVAVNTAMPWSIGSGYDFYSVMLHETGLTLGLGEPPNPSVVMATVYGGVRTGLTAGDIAGIQAIYGARTPDAYQSAGQALGINTAVDMSGVLDKVGFGVVQNASLATIGDTEYFSFVAPANATGVMAVTATSSGVSMLSPQVTIETASGAALASGSNPSAWSDAVSAETTGVVPGQRYYVAVTGATSDVFAVGAYKLGVAFTTNPAIATPTPTPTPTPTKTTTTTPVSPPVTVHSTPPQNPANISFATAYSLGTVAQTIAPGLSLGSANAPTFFVFQTSQAGMYWVGAAGMNVRVYNSTGHLLTAGPGLVALPVTRAHTILYIEVLPSASTPEASYNLAIASFAFGTGPSSAVVKNTAKH